MADQREPSVENATAGSTENAGRSDHLSHGMNTEVGSSPSRSDEALLQKLLMRLEAKRLRPQKTSRSTTVKPPKAVRPAAELSGRKLLGQGGLGAVYRYHDQRLGRDLALKVCQQHILSLPAGVERFIRERRITAKLTHPSIPPVHHCGELKDGRPYYVMRLIRGRSLQRLLQQRQSLPLDFRTDRYTSRLLDAFERVCDAAQYAHDAGVIHRDIKPANIIVEKHGAAYLVDWGLARELTTSESAPSDPSVENVVVDTNLTSAAHRIGSPDYMSPEQATGDVEHHSPLTDVYGLGATLFHILTGVSPHGATRPVERETRNQIYEQIANTVPPEAVSIVPHLPPALSSICRKALQRDPPQRYRSAGELRDDLVRWRRNEIVEAHGNAYSLGDKLQLFSSRHRGAVATAAAFLVVLVAMSSFSAIHLRKTNLVLRSTVDQVQAGKRQLDIQNVQLVSTNLDLDEKIVQLGAVNEQLESEKERLELALEIGFKMLKGIETSRYRSLDDAYSDIVQNGVQLPDEERIAMLPLYRALVSLQKADSLFNAALQISDGGLLSLPFIRQANKLSLKKQAENELAQAKQELDLSISLCDTIGLAWLLRGQLRMEWTDEVNESVLEDWNRATELLPDSSAAFSGRAWCYSRMKHNELAFSDFKQAIELDPANDFAHRGIGQVYFSEEKWEQALDHYYTALELPKRYDTNPKWNDLLYWDIGVTHWSRGKQLALEEDWPGSVDEFSKALLYCPAKDRLGLWSTIDFCISNLSPTPESLAKVRELDTLWKDEAGHATFELTRSCLELLVAWRVNSLAFADVDQLLQVLEEGESGNPMEIHSNFVDAWMEVLHDERLSDDEAEKVRLLINHLRQRIR